MSKYMSMDVSFCEFTVCPGMCMCIYECLGVKVYLCFHVSEYALVC